MTNLHDGESVVTTEMEETSRTDTSRTNATERFFLKLTDDFIMIFPENFLWSFLSRRHQHLLQTNTSPGFAILLGGRAYLKLLAFKVFEGWDTNNFTCKAWNSITTLLSVKQTRLPCEFQEINRNERLKLGQEKVPGLRN